MAFDGNVQDYTKVTPPAVYDNDNPPPTIGEAIRMAVADVRLLLDKGFKYDWMEADLCSIFGRCATCTAGAVVARANDYSGATVSWLEETDSDWNCTLNALSLLTQPGNYDSVADAQAYWPEGFPTNTRIKFACPDLNEVGFDAWSSALLDLADRFDAEAA